MGFPGGSEGKASACNAGDLGSIPGPGRSPGEGNGNLLQYSCLENPMDRAISIVNGEFSVFSNSPSRQQEKTCLQAKKVTCLSERTHKNNWNRHIDTI